MKTVRELVDASLWMSPGWERPEHYAQADALDAELARLRGESATLEDYIKRHLSIVATARNDALEEAAKLVDAAQGYDDSAAAHAIRSLKTPVDGGADG